MTYLKKVSPHLLIKIATVLTLFGWAIIHIFWDTPYRTIFWNEGLLRSVIENLTSLSWTEYVTSKKTDQLVNTFSFLIGIHFAITAIVILIKNERFSKYFLYSSSFLLFFMFFCGFMSKGYQLPYLIEHAIQIAIPFIFYKSLKNEKFTLLAKSCIALTFIGHGIYAMGIYPRPGGFIDMMINVLGMSQERSVFFLIQLGIIDFIVAIFIFIKPYQKYALFYCFMWGMLTAFARILSFKEDYLQWAPETIIRLVHGLLPLAIFLIVVRNFGKDRELSVEP